MPGSLRSAVQARVRRTGAGAETLLRAAAVLGSAVDPVVLGDLLGLRQATALELCETALEARLLVVSGRDYEFANDLIREVMYTSTPEPARLAYHRQAADLFTGQPESLARHAAAAGDWPRAARAWLLAAEDAMRRFAASDAGTLATQALDAARRAGNAEAGARALVVRGRAREAAGAHDIALADLTKGASAARAAGDRRLEMLALRELGGDVPVSRGLPITYYASNLQSGLRIAESLGDRASEADLLSRLAIIAANRLHLDEALRASLRAVTAARASADDRALAAALDGLKLAYLSLGDLAGLAGVLAELTPLLRRLDDLFRLPWAEFKAGFLSVAAALGWAAPAFETAVEVNRRGGYPHCAAWYVAHLGWLARLRGRDGEALALGRQAVALTGEHDTPGGGPQHTPCSAARYCAPATGPRRSACSSAAWPRPGRRGWRRFLLRCAAPRLAAATGSRFALADAGQGCWSRPQSRRAARGCPATMRIFHSLRRGSATRNTERAQAILAPLLAVAERAPWTATLAAALVTEAHALHALGESGDRATGEPAARYRPGAGARLAACAERRSGRPAQPALSSAPNAPRGAG